MNKTLDFELSQRLGAFLAWRLPDGRVLTVTTLTFGRGRVNIGDELGISNSW